MREKASPRWYQYSLRTLLLLLAITSLPLGAYVAYKSYLVRKRLAEIEGSFRWLESLDYEDMPNARPIRITTRIWRADDDGHEANSETGVGFLLSEDSASFKVLSPSLEPVTMERSRREQGINSDSSFERSDLRTIAREALARATSTNREPFDRFGRVLSERGELFVLAWACARHGRGDFAIKLYETAEKTENWNDNRDSTKPFLERLADDFAYMETWQATLACGTKLPRPELLKKFRWLQRHFPNSEYAASVNEKVALFEAMVKEDEQHARERESSLPFEQLPKEEQIAELIFQLRDQNGRQFSQPGWCDVLMTEDGDWFGKKGTSPGHQLLGYGYDAIPPLAAALSDQRLTRSVGYHRNFYFSHKVLTVGDAAEQILERIASRSFDPAERYEEAVRMAEVKKNVLAWQAALMAKGERRCLIEAVEKGDRTGLSLARLLLEKYPDDACSAILAAIPRAEDEYCRNDFVTMLGQIRSEQSVAFLLEELHQEKCFIRLSAARALTALDQQEGVDVMAGEWRSSQQIAELESVGPFLARFGGVDAIDAVRERFLEQPIDQRLETMKEAVESWSERSASNPALRNAVIELLLAGLGDKDVRSGMSGSYGDKSFSDPRVCDLAGYHLNCLDPDAYRFDLSAPISQRDAARRGILKARSDR